MLPPRITPLDAIYAFLRYKARFRLEILVSKTKCVMAVLIALISFSLVQCGGGPSSQPPLTATATKPHVNGVWTTLPYLINNNPVHAVLLHTGEAFVVSGSGDDESLKIYNSSTLDFSAGTITTRAMAYDSFCAGLTILLNGNPFLAGGSRYDEINSPGQELGLPNVSTYDTTANLFVNL